MQRETRKKGERMEEIRIKIHDDLPYDLIFNTIRDLLLDDIGEEDESVSWNVTVPALDCKYKVTYKKGKTKRFEVWKTE